MWDGLILFSRHIQYVLDNLVTDIHMTQMDNIIYIYIYLNGYYFYEIIDTSLRSGSLFKLHN